MRMNVSLLRFTLLSLCLVCRAFSADSAAEPKSNMKETLKTLLIEDAKHLPVQPAVQSASPSAPAVPKNVPASVPDASSKTVQVSTAPKGPEAPATALPGMEVRNRRITELDIQLHAKDIEINREAHNMKSTELDKALNNPKLASALSLFGGKSNEYRESISTERVKMMQEERDLMEEISRAKTPEEKKELQEQLDEIKSMRRDLEHAIR